MSKIDTPLPDTASVFLSPAQAAERYGYSQKTLANWRFKGIGPKYVVVHGRPRYRLADLQAWIATMPKRGRAVA